jgi:hypothetical protein
LTKFSQRNTKISREYTLAQKEIPQKFPIFLVGKTTKLVGKRKNAGSEFISEFNPLSLLLLGIK